MLENTFGTGIVNEAIVTNESFDHRCLAPRTLAVWENRGVLCCTVFACCHDCIFMKRKGICQC